MRLEQLRYLESAIRCGSMRKAAQEVGISQPSLSAQIRALEEDLDVVLLLRRPDGVQPTDAAQELAPLWRMALRAEDAMRQEASAIGGLRIGNVRLGAIASASRLLVPDFVRGFRSQYSGVELQVTEAGSITIEHQVQSGELDLGIVSRLTEDSDATDGLELVELDTSRLSLHIPRGHRLAGRRSVTAEDFAHEDLIAFSNTFTLRRAFDQITAGLNPTIVYRTNSAETAFELVRAGAGLAMLSARDTQRFRVEGAGQVATVPIDHPWANTRMLLIRRAGEVPSPAVRQAIIEIRSRSHLMRTTR